MESRFFTNAFPVLSEYSRCGVETHDSSTYTVHFLKQRIDLIGEVFEEYGSMSKWEIRDRTHLFPEWEDPRGSSRDIPIRNILERNGTTEPQVESIL